MIWFAAGYLAASSLDECKVILERDGTQKQYETCINYEHEQNPTAEKGGEFLLAVSPLIIVLVVSFLLLRWCYKKVDRYVEKRDKGELK